MSFISVVHHNTCNAWNHNMVWASAPPLIYFWVFVQDFPSMCLARAHARTPSCGASCCSLYCSSCDGRCRSCVANLIGQAAVSQRNTRLLLVESLIRVSISRRLWSFLWQKKNLVCLIKHTVHMRLNGALMHMYIFHITSRTGCLFSEQISNIWIWDSPTAVGKVFIFSRCPVSRTRYRKHARKKWKTLM